MTRPVRVAVQIQPGGTPDYRTWRDAVLAADDPDHGPAAERWHRLLDGMADEGTTPVTHSGVVTETAALVQRRLGMDALRALLDEDGGVTPPPVQRPPQDTTGAADAATPTPPRRPPQTNSPARPPASDAPARATPVPSAPAQ